MSAAAPPRTRNRHKLVLLLFALTFIGLAGRWFYHRVTERSRVIDAIIAAGGKHQSPTSQPGLDRLIARLSGDRGAGDEVFLDGPNFDEAWLVAQHDLRSLDVRQLMIRDTRLSRTAVLRLVERHSLDSLVAQGIPLTDADAGILADQKNLTHLTLMHSEFTDTGLAALNPQRLRALNIAGTRVTSVALQKELAGAPQLQYLMIDGQQFTPELAAQLSPMKSLYMIALIGPDVTDEHVKLLESMPNLRYMRMDQTSVSEEAVAALRAARPAPATIEVAPPAEVFFKWRSE